MQYDTKPLISVIIPIHNRSEDLTRSVPSVLSQTEQSFELLIIDDASTEDLKPIVEGFNDARIKLIRNDIKGNAGSVRNKGMELAQGNFIAFLDSDDDWFPEHLSTRIAFINDQNVDGVYGSAFVFDGESATFVLSKNKRDKQHAADYLLSGGSIPTPTWVMRSEAARSIHFDISLVVHEDYDFFIRFDQKYKWAAMWQPTTRVYWRPRAARLRHPKSEISFVQKYFDKISPKSYFAYCLSQLEYYRNDTGDDAIINYYRTECMRYIKHLSFVDFCSVKKGSPFLLTWLHFSFLILVRKFKNPQPPKTIL